jgi:hypothetical protein
MEQEGHFQSTADLAYHLSRFEFRSRAKKRQGPLAGRDEIRDETVAQQAGRTHPV